MDLFVAIQPDKTIRQLKLDARAHAVLSQTFSEIGAAFFGPKTEVFDYEAGFIPDGDGVVRVELALPNALKRCGLQKPSELPALDPKTLRSEPPIALVAIAQGRTPRFTFQAVDNRNLLRPGGVLLFGPKSFGVNRELAVAVSGRIDAVSEGKYLYFRNEHTVRRFLDIDHLFRAATDDELASLFAQTAFCEVELAAIQLVATEPLRRKLHFVLASGRPIKPKIVQAVGERVGQTVQIRRGALVVPTERTAFREFVRILADDYLESLQYQDQLYLTTSKRRVKGR